MCALPTIFCNQYENGRNFTIGALKGLQKYLKDHEDRGSTFSDMKSRFFRYLLIRREERFGAEVQPDKLRNYREEILKEKTDNKSFGVIVLSKNETSIKGK